jgi:hypothetical protein
MGEWKLVENQGQFRVCLLRFFECPLPFLMIKTIFQPWKVRTSLSQESLWLAACRKRKKKKEEEEKKRYYSSSSVFNLKNNILIFLKWHIFNSFNSIHVKYENRHDTCFCGKTI